MPSRMQEMAVRSHRSHPLQRWRTPAWQILLLPLLQAAAAPGQGLPIGAQFQVNSYTTSTQQGAQVATDPQGRFVVTWQSFGSPGSDNGSPSIQAQRFDPQGNPLGAQFQVNTYTTGNQALPAVAADGLGNFVVVWESYGSVGNDSSLRGIQGRRFDTDGNALGSQFQVNTYTTNSQFQPTVSADVQGNFIVAWTSSGSAAGDSSSYSIQSQRYDAAGAPVGGEFQVNSYTTGPQLRPRVASGPPAEFVIAWMSLGSSGGDTDSYSVQGRRVVSGVWASEFQVNSFTSNSQTYPAVGVDPSGGFVVAWTGYDSGGNDNSGTSVQARRFDALDLPLGADFQVNSYTTFNQRQPALSVDANGSFVVAWESIGSSGTDSDSSSIHARRFASDGGALGGEFQVNTYTTSYQDFAALAATPAGDFVVTWRSRGSFGNDSDGDSIQAQRENGHFRDGFETGDLSRWSSAVP